VKKIIIIAILFVIFVKVVMHYNNRWNEEFFDGFYSYEYDDTKESEEATLWEKISGFVENVFTEEPKEEKFIYK